MNRVIKSENSAAAAHESAGRQRIAIGEQVSDWGETTEDEAVSDISDKLGVLLAEMGEEEDAFAQNLDEYRTVLKHIRDTEGSVQPTRDQRAKISDEIQRVKLKDPNSHKIGTLEQELVRAEAQNLVAEAQLVNVTRQRFKEAYSIHLAAVIERSEKQALLAHHGRRLLNCIDDTSVVPGDEARAYMHGAEAKRIIEQAEQDIRSWRIQMEPVHVEDSGAQALPTGISPTSSGRGAPVTTATDSQAIESQGAETREFEPQAMGATMGTGAMETQAMGPQAVESQDMRRRDMDSEEMRRQEIQAQEMKRQEIASQEMRRRDMEAEEMRRQEIESQELQRQEMEAQEMRRREMEAEAMRRQEMESQEVRRREMEAEAMRRQEMESREAEYMKGEPEDVQAADTQAEDTSAWEDYSQVSPTNAAPRERVHSMAAPMMDADALEARNVAASGADRGLNRGEEMGGAGLKGMGEKQKTSAMNNQAVNGGISDNPEFTFRPKKRGDHLGTPLDAHVQRVAVPI